jgi:Cu+-exporting ATPase
MGIEAALDGRKILAGDERLLTEQGIELPAALAGELATHRAAGQTPLLVAYGNEYLGALLIADPLAPHSAQGVVELKSLGLHLVLLSGDKEATAQAIAQAAGIAEVIAEVKPDEKQREVSRLRGAGQVVAMVGDGINDAPALAAADLGIAIGSGADVAIESADVVLVRPDLQGVATTIRLSRATLRTIRQNLAWAFVYNLLLLPLAAGVLIPLLGISFPPVLAAAAMAASSVSVVANSLLLRLKRI